MIMINLLPHREERRKRKKIAFFAGLGVAAFVGVAIVGVWYLVVQQLISGQQQRNAFLQTEIAKLDIQIKDIASLKAEIASLKARQKAVEDLQIDRNVPVHVLNELVEQVPEGIYITAVKQDGQNAQRRRHRADAGAGLRAAAQHRLQLGVARQARAGREQGRDASRARTSEQKRLFDFSVRLTVKRPQDTPAAAPPARRAPRAIPAPRAGRAVGTAGVKKT